MIGSLAYENVCKLYGTVTMTVLIQPLYLAQLSSLVAWDGGVGAYPLSVAAQKFTRCHLCCGQPAAGIIRWKIERVMTVGHFLVTWPCHHGLPYRLASRHLMALWLITPWYFAVGIFAGTCSCLHQLQINIYTAVGRHWRKLLLARIAIYCFPYCLRHHTMLSASSSWAYVVWNLIFFYSNNGR